MKLREDIGRKKHTRRKVVGGVKGRYWEEETHEKESGWWSQGKRLGGRNT